MDGKTYITAAAAANRLGVTTQTAHNMAWRGELPGTIRIHGDGKRGAILGIPESAVELAKAKRGAA